jgi:hypothetical protein
MSLLEEVKERLALLSATNLELSGNNFDPTTDELIKRIEARLNDSIEVIWHLDDVKQIREDLDDDECREVLESVKDRHDCNNGITWETLELMAERLYPQD